MAELARIGVAIDADLLAKFDDLIGQRGYTNRSEAFRDLIRDELVEKTWEAPNAAVVGTVTLVVRSSHPLAERETHRLTARSFSPYSVYAAHSPGSRSLPGSPGSEGQGLRSAPRGRCPDQHQGRETWAADHHHYGSGLVIVGTGVDLCEVDRIEAAIGRHGARFVQRIFTPREIAYVERKANKFERYAARFAAKEAGMKSHRNGLAWRNTLAGFRGDQPAFRAPPCRCTASPRNMRNGSACSRWRFPSRTRNRWPWPW